MSISGTAQSVYERGTFISIPSGKHVNHSYYGTWNVYFAVEDGVLVYDHHHGQWLDPITASNGLIQYPALLVWQDPGTQDVWIVTPDNVFLYDHLTDWMSRAALPGDALFSGKYELAVSDRYVVVTSVNSGAGESYSAVFLKSSGTFETWGTRSTLDLDWENLQPIGNIDSGLNLIYESLPIQTVRGGGFDANGLLHLDNYPRASATEVSSISGDVGSGETFLSTYGMGVFHQKIAGGVFSALPFGLLSPDVMCLELVADELILGGRAGVTYLHGFQAAYDEAIRDPVFDYSFVSAIDQRNSDLLIAGRGGVFIKKDQRTDWDRIISKKDLVSKRIYSIAAGDHGNIMVATERNAYLFHESGLLLRTMFTTDLDWPVFDINYSEGRYYLSSYYGLFIFDEASLSFIARINSNGEIHSPGEDAGIDPIYESIFQGETLWASTHRGLIKVDLVLETGLMFLAPNAPFKPRGLSIVGHRTWVGTDLGLFSFEPGTGAWRHYTRNDGLISNFVTDLVANENYIWLGTNLGLTRIKWRNLE